MFEGPVRTKSKFTDSSNDVSFTLARWRQTARPVSISRIGLKLQIFSTPLSFSGLVRCDLCGIYEKALKILKLEFSRQPIVKTIFD